MSQERLSMRKLQEVLRLEGESRTLRGPIARSCGISPATVSEYVQRASAAGWQVHSFLQEPRAKPACGPACSAHHANAGPDASRRRIGRSSTPTYGAKASRCACCGSNIAKRIPTATGTPSFVSTIASGRVICLPHAAAEPCGGGAAVCRLCRSDGAPCIARYG